MRPQYPGVEGELQSSGAGLLPLPVPRSLLPGSKKAPKAAIPGNTYTLFPLPRMENK